VKLVDERDRFGKRKLALDWQWTADDKRSMLRFQELLAEALGRDGIGRMRIELDNDAVSFGLPFNTIGRDKLDNFIRAGNHHMGTTRMSASPRAGVTDPDCRVHSTRNLYVAGSSVFPTAGLWNPTLTIVALALRLADHLKKEAP
jgi:choline dehydrogenase-like flavoprotein